MGLGDVQALLPALPGGPGELRLTHTVNDESQE